MIKGIGQEMCCAKEEKIDLPELRQRFWYEIEKLRKENNK
jgi:hypothetical protein